MRNQIVELKTEKVDNKTLEMLKMTLDLMKSDISKN